MGIFDALKKKSKETPSSYPETPPLPEEPVKPSIEPRPISDPSEGKDFELVLIKLDLVLHKISDIEKRLEEIERIAKEE